MSEGPERWTKDLPPNDLPAMTSRNGENIIPFHRLVQIDPDNLQREFEIQAAWENFFGFHHQTCRLATERKARELKEMEATAYLEYKEKAKETKATVAQIEASVMSDPRVKKLYSELMDAKTLEVQWESAKWAWSSRKDMLVQIGADMRADKKHL